MPDITSGSDGALWFTVQYENTIGRITTSGAVTTESSPGTGVVSGVTSGSDGAVWYTGFSEVVGGPSYIGQIALAEGPPPNVPESSETVALPVLAGGIFMAALVAARRRRPRLAV